MIVKTYIYVAMTALCKVVEGSSRKVSFTTTYIV